MKRKQLIVIVLVICLLTIGCGSVVSQPTLEPTLEPTPTPVPQVLGRIFPDEFHDQAVWSNAGGNASRNYCKLIR